MDNGVCYKEFIWNPSNCECEYDKSCDIGEYLYYENYKCRTQLVGKLIECNSVECRAVERSSAEECTENIDEVKIADKNECVCSYIICVALIVIALTISIGIGAFFVFSSWYLKKDISCVKFGTRT